MKKIAFITLLILGFTSCCRKATPVASEPPKEFPAEIRTTPLSGGYSAPRPLTEAEQTLFREQVSSQIDGVSYTPESVATQIVAGTNYKFHCAARTTTLNPQSYKADIVLFIPLPCNDTKSRVSITRVDE